MENSTHEDKEFKNIVFQKKETRDKVFENCKFINCDFSNSIFRATKFIDCTFTNCNLSMAKLNNCQLNTITFNSCKLMGINFGDCADFLFSVSFDNCVLDYSFFVRKKMPKTIFLNSSVKNVDFSETDLSKAKFTNSDLLNAVFDKTILKETDFTSATNYIIDPEINFIKKAKFSLHGIPGLLAKYDISIE